jgi:hypothetical protein
MSEQNDKFAAAWRCRLAEELEAADQWAVNLTAVHADGLPSRHQLHGLSEAVLGLAPTTSPAQNWCQLATYLGSQTARSQGAHHAFWQAVIIEIEQLRQKALLVVRSAADLSSTERPDAASPEQQMDVIALYLARLTARGVEKLKPRGG